MSAPFTADPDNERQPLLGTTQVAAWLGMSREQVWKLWSAGKLPGYKLDRHLRFAPADVETFMAAAYTGTTTAGTAVSKPSRPCARVRQSTSPYHRI